MKEGICSINMCLLNRMTFFMKLKEGWRRELLTEVEFDCKRDKWHLTTQIHNW